MDSEKPKAPGLRWRKRGRGRPSIPVWYATEKAVKAGYLPKQVRLHYEDTAQGHADLVARCNRLQAEMTLTLSGHNVEALQFDGTFGALVDRYLRDPESSYQTLKPSSRHPYAIYAVKLKAHIGARRIDHCDGRDVQRWFKIWAGIDNLRDPAARLPRARATLNVLKAAVSFGVICRLPACADFSAILTELEFPSPKRRDFAPTEEQVRAARAAAHAAGAPSRALAYALQWDTSLRQWDVTGQWLPLSDPRPSGVLDHDEKWIGPTWAMVDKDLVLRLVYGKTEDTSAAAGVYDLSVCPMVMEELAHHRKRRGPLIVNEDTDLPYEYDDFLEGWKSDFADADLDPKMWNRDLRAGAITEAGIRGAARSDVSKGAGHTTERMVAKVYDRDRLEAHRRVMAARARKNDAGT